MLSEGADKNMLLEEDDSDTDWIAEKGAEEDAEGDMKEIWQCVNHTMELADCLREKDTPGIQRMIQQMEAVFPQARVDSRQSLAATWQHLSTHAQVPHLPTCGPQRPHDEEHKNQQVSDADIKATRKRHRDQALADHLSECARIQRAQEEAIGQIPTDLTQTDEQAEAEKNSDRKAKRRQTTMSEHFAQKRWFNVVRSGYD